MSDCYNLLCSCIFIECIYLHSEYPWVLTVGQWPQQVSDHVFVAYRVSITCNNIIHLSDLSIQQPFLMGEHSEIYDYNTDDDNNEVSGDDDEDEEGDSSLSDSLGEDSIPYNNNNWRVERLLREEYIAEFAVCLYIYYM